MCKFEIECNIIYTIYTIDVPATLSNLVLDIYVTLLHENIIYLTIETDISAHTTILLYLLTEGDFLFLHDWSRNNGTYCSKLRHLCSLKNETNNYVLIPLKRIYFNSTLWVSFLLSSILSTTIVKRDVTRGSSRYLL